MIRHATEQDLPRIIEIYNSTVPTHQSTADTTEVSIKSRRTWFKKHNPKEKPILVYDIDGKVVAWISLESFYGRQAYHNTAEISIYVAPEYHRQRIGWKLLEEIIKMTPELGIKTLVGYIFSHNDPCLRLFQSFGFEEWGRLPNVAEMNGKEYSLSIVGKRI